MGKTKSFPRDLFGRVTAAALPRARMLVETWLPDGRLVGEEYIARNPNREDRRPGSFKINVQTGLWADFAVPVGGCDLISLWAYLNNCSQMQAALRLAELLDIEP